MAVRIQQDDFDAGNEILRMRLAHPQIGAVVNFLGQVRGLNEGNEISSMFLEHYPGMTEKALEAIIEEAKERWSIHDATIIHRVGNLKPLDQIVLVVVAATHRGNAFKACEFIMDFLKTEAPFWKKEITPLGAHWVEAKISDDIAKEKWNSNSIGCL